MTKQEICDTLKANFRFPIREYHGEGWILTLRPRESYVAIREENGCVLVWWYGETVSAVLCARTPKELISHVNQMIYYEQNN